MIRKSRGHEKGSKFVEKLSYLKSINADYIDDVYRRYLQNPFEVEESWRTFFEGVEFGMEAGSASTPSVTSSAATAAPRSGASTANLTVVPPSPTPSPAAGPSWELELRAYRLIEAYRSQGYLIARLNPLDPPPAMHPNLDPATHGLTDADKNKTVQISRLVGAPNELFTITQLIERLQSIYSRTIGIEYMQIHKKEERDWVESQIENFRLQRSINPETKKWIHTRLAESEGFERFLHTRYVAQKRFSIEGAESLIPGLDALFERGAELGAKEFIIGMAHRGRLNVLTNIMGKPTKMMFTEFEGKYAVDLVQGEGDVKYHKGYSRDLKTKKGRDVHLSLCANPSHLEFVGAVALGVVRAKQDQRNDKDRAQVIPVVIHGDAALAGQGVCYEMLNLSQLNGYGTGGTIHLVINNQVGFTTSARDARSTRYSTDLGLMLEVPILHVNGDDTEAVASAFAFAMEYRQQFKKDIFVDLICYRKYGHNEGDEPTFTQPMMYAKVKAHPTPREGYAKRLVAEGVFTDADAQGVVDRINEAHLAAQAEARSENPTPKVSAFEGVWAGYRQPAGEEIFEPVRTAVEGARLKDLAKKLNTIPASFHLHPKLTRFFEARQKAIDEGNGIDWGNAETLAYGTLVTEGHLVRLSGQDAERGTFTHRHAVLHDSENGSKIVPLGECEEGQAPFNVYNSHLSETGVMGFEHGFSLAAPNALTIWEAQFGDFANGAQVIIDQFIASSESKWRRMSGLTLLLPHGYEGQGPEHSSARLERFLQLAARQNMYVANLSTPAQIFHALRRQVKTNYRKPLVVMSPKSLLRNPLAISTLKDLTDGKFEEVIGDTTVTAANVKRVLICTGKVYYDLVHKRTDLERKDVAIVRLEQIYPFHEKRLAEILAGFPNAKDIVWVQEEPRNMGAWSFVFQMWAGGLSHFAEKVGGRMIRYVGREVAAAPAVGSPKVHEQQQKELVEGAFAIV